MKRGGACITIVLSFCLITGCTLPWSRARPPEEEEVLKIARVLRYFQDVKSLSQEELSHLYAYEERQLLRSQDDLQGLKLALLLTIPNAKSQDISRSLSLLDAYIADDQHPETLRDFASLLSYILHREQDQERLYEIVSKKLYSTIKERDEKEKLYQNAKERVDIILDEKKRQESLYKELHKELVNEKATVENLRKKIEQLKTIEKSINDRKRPKDPAT